MCTHDRIHPWPECGVVQYTGIYALPETSYFYSTFIGLVASFLNSSMPLILP